MGPLLLSAGTVQAVPLLDRLAPARNAGFEGVSIFAADLEALERQGVGGAEVRRRVSDAGLFIHELEIVGRWLSGHSTKANPLWLTELLDRSTAERLVALADAVGARGITVAELQGVAWHSEEEAAEAFARVCTVAAGAGLHVALEFVPTGTISSLAVAWEIVRGAGAANGGLLVDAWHFFRSDPDLALLASLPAEAVRSVQLSDAPATPAADLDQEMVRGRLLPGAGALDLRGFLRALGTSGVTAPIGVEVFSDSLAREPIEEVARRCATAARRMLEEGI
jgi:sugar phosphate isomerase/epimerase